MAARSATRGPGSRIRAAFPLAFVALGWGSACNGPFDRDADATQCVSEPRPSVDLIVAGSGSVLPLAAQIHASLQPQGFRIWMPESIGTSGAIGALRDGAADIGLMSRWPTPEERQGRTLVPLARAVVSFGAHVSGAPPDLSEADLVAIFDGTTRVWPDGTPIVPLLREPGDSGEAQVRAHLPGVADAMERAREAARWPVRYTDQEMLASLVDTPGAIGVVDLGLALGTRLQPVSVQGVAPSEVSVLSGEWRLVKPLVALVADSAPPEARQAWRAAAERLAQAPPPGWLPLNEGPP